MLYFSHEPSSLFHHSVLGAYLGNFKQYALVDRGANGGSANRDVRGKKSIIGEETSCKTFHSGKLSSQQYNFVTKLYARAFWRTCSYAPVNISMMMH